MNRLYIWLIIITVLITSLVLIGEKKKIITTSSYNSKEMINKISHINSKTELKKIFDENNQIPLGEVEPINLFLLRTDICKALHKPLKEKTFKAIIEFLSDKQNLKKYSLYGVLNDTIITIIKLSHYSEKQKEITLKKLKDKADDLSDLNTYFLNTNNQKTPLFDLYVEWCLKENYFYPIFDLFDNMTSSQQLEIIQKINPLSESNSDYDQKSQIAFLKKVSSSDKYLQEIKNIAERKLESLKNDNERFIIALSKVTSVSQVINVIKNFEQFKNDYNTIEHVLFQSKSISTQKAILKFLSENCKMESQKIGNIIWKIVISQKFDMELKELAMSHDAFTYNENYRKKLCDYFSNKDNQNNPLYKKFVDFIISYNDNKDSMDFIRNNFDDFKDDEKLRITKNINLSHIGDLTPQFIFFKHIIKNDKYSNNLKEIAKLKLSKLERNKKKFDKLIQKKSAKEMLQNCVNGFEQIIIQKVVEPDKTGHTFSNNERKTIDLMFRGVEKNIDMITKAQQMNQKNIETAKRKISELKRKVDGIIKKKEK